MQHIVINEGQNYQKLGATALDLYSASATLLCVGDSCIRVISSIPIGRNLGPSGPVNSQAKRNNTIEETANHFYNPSSSVCSGSILLDVEIIGLCTSASSCGSKKFCSIAVTLNINCNVFAVIIKKKGPQSRMFPLHTVLSL